MRVLVSGLDFPARPHLVSFLTRAFRRLGCEVVRAAGAGGYTPGGSGYVDPVYAPPDVVVGGGGMVGLSEVVRAVGGQVDLAVHVDQGDPWAVANDGTCPFGYVWREVNPGEEGRVRAAAGAGCPVFVCMTGPHKVAWPDAVPLPFAADSELFCEGPLCGYDERPDVLIYTGRERGASGNARLAGLGQVCTPGYLEGYHVYRDALGHARSTVVLDAATYVGSRGVEAMAQGVPTFWDRADGAVAWMGFDWGMEALRCERKRCPSTGEWMPDDNFFGLVTDLMQDKARWTRISLASRKKIATEHTYDHRARRIAAVCGVRLP